mmetsp:Transcript_17708/g.35003  ORF Transcript_17708/g.35003 Transcript_17708/m.35003 type:complete len:384 (+) Transcript_17708:103-1254(+)
MKGIIRNRGPFGGCFRFLGVSRWCPSHQSLFSKATDPALAAAALVAAAAAVAAACAFLSFFKACATLWRAWSLPHPINSPTSRIERTPDVWLTPFSSPLNNGSDAVSDAAVPPCSSITPLSLPPPPPETATCAFPTAAFPAVAATIVDVAAAAVLAIQSAAPPPVIAATAASLPVPMAKALLSSRSKMSKSRPNRSANAHTSAGPKASPMSFPNSRASDARSAPFLHSLPKRAPPLPPPPLPPPHSAAPRAAATAATCCPGLNPPLLPPLLPPPLLPPKLPPPPPLPVLPPSMLTGNAKWEALARRLRRFRTSSLLTPNLAASARTISVDPPPPTPLRSPAAAAAAGVAAGVGAALLLLVSRPPPLPFPSREALSPTTAAKDP